MRLSYLIALMLAAVFAGSYFHQVGAAICPVPIEYRVGNIDAEFSITSEEFQIAAATAESAWEQLADRELFVYNPDAPLTINLEFDERHQQVMAEQEFQATLDRTANISDAVRAEYEALVGEFEAKRATYRQAQADYEEALTTYNDRVAAVNAAGGATPEEAEALNAEAAELEAERQRVNQLANSVNRTVTTLNNLRDQNNELITAYNRGVNEYNETFGEARSFTQGVFRSDGKITIYTYTSQSELELVLAHEFGHALGMGHVENPASIMYFQLGEQAAELTPTPEDAAAFTAVCAERSRWDTIVRGFETLFNNYDAQFMQADSHPHRTQSHTH